MLVTWGYNGLCEERRDTGANVEAAESGAVEVVAVLEIVGWHHTRVVFVAGEDCGITQLGKWKKERVKVKQAPGASL